MFKQTTNEIERIQIKKQFFDDFDVFVFTNRAEKSKTVLSTLKHLDILDKVLVLYHESKSKHYVVTRKNIVNFKALTNDDYLVDQFFKNIDDVVVLNICLLLSAERNDIVPNNTFYKVLAEKGNQILALKLRFVRNIEDCDRKVYLKANVETLTNFKILRNMDKYKNANAFYARQGAQMVAVSRNYDGEKYLAANPFGKAEFDKFVIPSKCEKYDRDAYVASSVFGAMMDIFNTNCDNMGKYASFEFHKENVERYENHSKFDKMKKYEIKNIYNQMRINFVVDEEYQKILNEKLSDIFDVTANNPILIQSWAISNEVKDGYNIVLLDEGKTKQITESDMIYNETKQKSSRNCVIQHMVKGNENRESILTCIIELLIKESLLNNKLISFMSGILPAGKEYSFYMTTKVKEDGEETEKYHKLTIRNDEISYVVNQKDVAEEDYEYYSDEFISIVEEGGSAIRIYETDECIFPDFKRMNEIISKACELNEDIVPLYYVKELLEEAFESEEVDNKTKTIIKELLDNTSDFNQYDLEMPIKEIREVYFKSKALQNVFKLIFGDDINLCLQKRYEDGIDGLYPAFIDISYNDSKYMVATDHSLSYKMARGISVRRYEVDGRNFFEELLPAFYVPFVKRNNLTVYPFPFKLLREAIEIL